MTTHFDLYREERVLSRRTTTSTLLCRDESDGLCVLKLFRGPSESAREKLRDRAGALKALDHPGLARCLDFVEGDDDVAIVYAWVPGDTVATLIERGQRFTDDELWDCLAQVTTAMDAAHHAPRPVVHRDIKPQNLVREGDRYILIDFDAAREVVDRNSNASIVGTTGYAAPEQFIGRAVPASDQYGLAATVLHMATHRHPGEFELKQLRIDLGKTEFATPLKRMLTRMLEPQPESRFPDGATVLDAIERGSGVEPWETALVPLEALADSIVTTTRTPDELRFDIGPRWRPASMLIASVGSLVITAASLIAVLVYDVRFTLGALGIFALLAGIPHAWMEWRRRRPSVVRITDDEWSIESGGKLLTGPRERPPLLAPTKVPSLETSMFIESRAGLTATSGDEKVDFGLGMLPAEAEAVRAAMESALAVTEPETALVPTDSTALVPASQRFEELDGPLRNPLRFVYSKIDKSRQLDSVPNLPADFVERLERAGFRLLGGVKNSLYGFISASKYACFVSEDGTVFVDAMIGGMGEAEPGMTYHIVSCVDAPRCRYTWSHSRITTSSTDRVSSAPTQGNLVADLRQHRQWVSGQMRDGHLPVRFERIEDRLAFSRFYGRHLAGAKTIAIVLTFTLFLLAPFLVMLSIFFI